MEQKKKLPGITRKEEEQYLRQVIEVAEQNLKKNREQEKKLAEDIYDLMETYGPKDTEALTMLHNTQVIYEETKRDRERCEKARKKPYFGRIDFFDRDTKQEEALYIGRVGISKDILEKVVIDWRAPVASVYYENKIGACSYSVKNEKTYEIDLHRKRTYEIEKDELKDYYDSDVVANDELLTKYLAKNKKAVLGEIIATIQQEQNAIIRKSPRQNVIVQGGAGSGKTTVAMHRISYILYNYEKEFRPEDFYIIGSNRVLLNYITGVLPDLDVYGVRQMTMEQLFVRLLYEDWDNQTMSVRKLDKTDQVLPVKGSLFWFQNLEEYCKKAETEVIAWDDIYLEIPSRQEKTGICLLKGSDISEYIRENPQTSVQSKIAMLNERLAAKIQNEIIGKDVAYTAEEKREILRTYRYYFGGKEWKKSIFLMYTEFMEEQRLRGYPVTVPETEYDVYDLAALAYLYKRVKETDPIREASHVVIDEAQDFGMMAYSVLKYCMQGCTFTIMGDVSQNIYYGYGLNDWEMLRRLMLTGPYDEFLLLKKSYRNTIEISNFAMQILRHGSFPVYPVEPIIRHGKEVSMEHYDGEEELLAAVKERIERWKQEAFETIAIVCRDDKEAKKVAKKLGKQAMLVGEKTKDMSFGTGVMVLSVAYTKGLEFDAVILWNPDGKKYPLDDAHVKLLYVAATRALHELAVCYLDNLTPVIAAPVPEQAQKLFREEKKPVNRRTEKKSPNVLQKKKPDVIQRPDVTQKPDIIRKPEATQKPDIIRKPDATQAADIIRKPDATQKPDIIRKPDTTQAADIIRKPDKTQKPDKIQKTLPKTTAKFADEKVRFLSGKGAFHRFGEIPDNGVLRPIGQGKTDTSIRWVEKQKNAVTCVSACGMLHVRPISEEILRVTFGPAAKIQKLAEEKDVKQTFGFQEEWDKIRIRAARISAEIEKASGAITFFDRTGKKLLAEKKNMPRQIDLARGQVWNYFDWTREERLSAKGILKDDRLPLRNTAKYICYGNKTKRLPYIHSSLGYGIAVAADGDVLCCNIPMYGPYVSVMGTDVIDYYFIASDSEAEVIDTYLQFMNEKV